VPHLDVTRAVVPLERTARWEAGEAPRPSRRASERARARKTVEAAAHILDTREDKTLRVTAEILGGSPKRVIPEEAERWGADLVVVGSHGYGFWDRLLLGSVSHAVASRAGCSVEIVRLPERGEG
jgi:nucleotide-binding universal stress UspA family protein